MENDLTDQLVVAIKRNRLLTNKHLYQTIDNPLAHFNDPNKVLTPTRNGTIAHNSPVFSELKPK